MPDLAVVAVTPVKRWSSVFSLLHTAVRRSIPRSSSTDCSRRADVSCKSQAGEPTTAVMRQSATCNMDKQCSVACLGEIACRFL